MRTIQRPATAAVLGILILAGVYVDALGQQAPQALKQQLVGSWTLISIRATRTDGTTDEPYGPHGRGTLIFEQNGRFALILVNPDVPKFASNKINVATPAECQAAVKGINAFFGSYSVSESDQTLVFHVEGASYPNFNDTDQKRIVKTITENELDFVNLAPPGGGTITELLYRRVK